MPGAFDCSIRRAILLLGESPVAPASCARPAFGHCSTAIAMSSLCVSPHFLISVPRHLRPRPQLCLMRPHIQRSLPYVNIDGFHTLLVCSIRYSPPLLAPLPYFFSHQPVVTFRYCCSSRTFLRLTFSFTPHPSTASPSTPTLALCPAFFSYLPLRPIGFGQLPVD